MMSMPSSICLRTTSLTAARSFAACAFSSTGFRCSFACTMSSRSGGRGRLPTWVVRIRSLLRFMAASHNLRTSLHHISHHHLAFARGALIKFRIHPACHAFALERRLELLADRGIFLVIGNGAAAFAQFDRAVVHELLARPTRFARALVVAPMPGGDAHAFLGDAEMLGAPAAAHGRGRDQADRLVLLAQDLVRLASVPGGRAERLRPRVGVAFAFDADQHGGGGVLMRFRIAAGLVLADPEVKAIAGHERLDPAETGPAPG